jgi:hypothetical protein
MSRVPDARLPCDTSRHYRGDDALGGDGGRGWGGAQQRPSVARGRRRTDGGAIPVHGGGVKAGHLGESGAAQQGARHAGTLPEHSPHRKRLPPHPVPPERQGEASCKIAYARAIYQKSRPSAPPSVTSSNATISTGCWKRTATEAHPKLGENGRCSDHDAPGRITLPCVRKTGCGTIDSSGDE